MKIKFELRLSTDGVTIHVTKFFSNIVELFQFSETAFENDEGRKGKT